MKSTTNPTPQTARPSPELRGPPPPTARATAAWLLDHGFWPVLVRPGGKAPAGRGWGLDRPTHSWLDAAFRRHPGAGVGILLGPAAGVVDLEEDDPAAGPAALAGLFPAGVPATAGWVSARGRHRLFRWHPGLAGLPAAVPLAGGVLELRAGGDGKQVMSVCPPTPAADGTPRRWADLGVVRPLPDGLVERLRALAFPPVRPRPAPVDRSDSVFGHLLVQVREARPGSRNRTLNRAAFVAGLLVGAGRLDRAAAEDGLLAAAEACGLPPWEAAATVARAVEAGARKAALSRS